MTIEIVLTPRELVECHKSPSVLRALADYHDCKSVESQAITGEFCEVHDARAKELRVEADRIESEY